MFPSSGFRGGHITNTYKYVVLSECAVGLAYMTCAGSA